MEGQFNARISRLERMQDSATEVPKPTAADAGKTIGVNTAGDYELYNGFRIFDNLAPGFDYGNDVVSGAGSNKLLMAALCGDMLYMYLRFAGSGLNTTPSSDAAQVIILQANDNIDRDFLACVKCAYEHGFGGTSGHRLHPAMVNTMFMTPAEVSSQLYVFYWGPESSNNPLYFAIDGCVSNGVAGRYAWLALACPHDKIIWPDEA